ncbi:hypothetical protein F4604DRAFT_1907393 [Suillus subluteus]|nr:hypothetical protein F4604DRAFT_1907393 [Suillus subluteus]
MPKIRGSKSTTSVYQTSVDTSFVTMPFIKVDKYLGRFGAQNRYQHPTGSSSCPYDVLKDLDHDPDFMACLGDKVKRRAVGSSPHIPTQFSFILAPAQQLTSLGPVLVVVFVPKEKAQFLPPSFKFLITCLLETDAAIILRGQHRVISKELDAVVTRQFLNSGFIADRTDLVHSPLLSRP